ncbi:hypothetical protein ScPMuIL_000161 [Solemya velum]
MGTTRKKQSKTKSRRGKSTQTKVSNKHHNKLAKQGKLKKNVSRKKKYLIKLQKLERAKSKGKETRNVKPSLIVEERELDDGDLAYYGKADGDLSFVSTVQSGLLSDGQEKKRKHVTDEEKEYEHMPRSTFGASQTKMKMMLPIKTREGVVPQLIEETEDIDMDSDIGEMEIIKRERKKLKPDDEPPPELSKLELLARRRMKLINRKSRIAMLASSVIENPQENISKLKELRSMLKETDSEIFITIRKLAMVSLMEIFKDIVPGYRIRIMTDSEKQQKFKKETQALQDFEESLLANYKFYLEYLETSAKGRSKSKIKQNGRVTEKEIPTDAAKRLSELAVKCLCEMLITHSHFNYRNNIITVLVPLMTNRIPQISDTACEAMKKLFREDKSGEVSLEVVKCIGRFIKSKNYEVNPKVLNTFLSLRIKEIDMATPTEKKNAQKKRETLKKMSRKDRKRKKQMESLERELLETRATESKTKKLKLHTETIQAVFLTYFRILKKAEDSVLLPAVLEGLARFAHLINIEFFDDLFAVFHKLIDSGELSYRESLHVVQTAFTILSGQGAALNIDPMEFYKHLYKNLFHLHAGETSGDVGIVLECLELMLSKRRRQISQQRLLAYTKRLCTLSLQQLPHGCLALLQNIRSFTQMYNSCDLLYDNDSHGSGVYLPELEDPEHCNAQNTMLWELPILRHHYHPVVCKYAIHLCHRNTTEGGGGAPLPLDLGRK